MENAVKALEYAFAVLVFVIAITISINLLNQSKSTSDLIFTSLDQSTYYDDVELTDAEKNANGRIVGVETIIPTLYRNFKENYVIEFYTKNKEELILRLDFSEENQRREIWTGNTNTDVKKRLDILINGGRSVTIPEVGTFDGVINNQGYNISDDFALKNSSARNYIVSNGLYKYCERKQFVEEYAHLLSEKEYSEEKIISRIEKIVIRYVEYDNGN